MAGTLLCGNNIVEWKKGLCIVEMCVLVTVTNDSKLMTKCINVGVSLQPAGGRVVCPLPRLVPSAGPHLPLAAHLQKAIYRGPRANTMYPGLCLQLHVVTRGPWLCAAVCSALPSSVPVSPS